MDSQIFPIEDVVIGGRTEQCVRGGRDKFPLAREALRGVERIGVIGWGSQARAQALNLRDTLAGSDIQVTVGLRERSSSWSAAQAAGFTTDDGGLGELFGVISSSDLVLLLISDAAQVANHARIAEAMKPGATLGLSHGFLVAHLESLGLGLDGPFSVVAVCPKGMGPSVRRLYQQGAELDGAGINASVAVHRALDSRAVEHALAWAVGIGAPVIFETDLVEEARSDIVGERAILLGGPHAIAEAAYRWYVDNGDDPATAFIRSTESMTGPLARAISRGGIRAVLDAVGDERPVFDAVYRGGYEAFAPIVEELYDDVASGDELRSVLRGSTRLERWPMPGLEGTGMWAVGEAVRSTRDERDVGIDVVTAGLFTALMVATVDTLAARGHRWSEIANESVIEIVDSLIPFMHARGVAHMVDNCSVTARLGARKWAPRFQFAIEHEVLPALLGTPASGSADGGDPATALEHHPIHDVLATMLTYRPAVDIAVI